MLKLLLFCFTFLVIDDLVLGKQDYTYSKTANGWFKLHQVPATWQDAFSTCNAEGVLLDKMPVNWGSYGNGTKPGSCLTFNPNGMVYTASCVVYLPFICYMKSKAPTELTYCGTFDNDYKPNALTGSCYKLHKERKEWNEAHRICMAEGAHLVVLNDRQEADVIMNLWPEEKSAFTDWNPLTHIGLLDWNKDFTWMTITGQKLENVFNTWADKMPDKKGENLCTCLLRDGTLDNFNCSKVTLQFTCEKDPNTSIFNVNDQYFKTNSVLTSTPTILSKY